MAIKTLLDAHGSMLSQVVVDEHESDRMVLVTEQDVTGIVDYCAEQAHMPGPKDMKHVAEIPLAVVERMMQEGSWNDPAAIKRWLNNPDNQAFRIWKGRV
jgi:hypothetical protein